MAEVGGSIPFRAYHLVGCFLPAHRAALAILSSRTESAELTQVGLSVQRHDVLAFVDRLASAERRPIIHQAAPLGQQLAALVGSRDDNCRQHGPASVAHNCPQTGRNRVEPDRTASTCNPAFPPLPAPGCTPVMPPRIGRSGSIAELNNERDFERVEEPSASATPIALRPPHPNTGEEIEREEVRRGYEYERGQFVTFTPAELKALDVESSDTVDLTTFVPRDEVDPIYFNAAYYVHPDGALAVQPYRVTIADAGYKNARVRAMGIELGGFPDPR